MKFKRESITAVLLSTPLSLSLSLDFCSASLGVVWDVYWEGVEVASAHGLELREGPRRRLVTSEYTSV